MLTRAAVFAALGPLCPKGQHEWRRLGTWTVYCRRCYHHHLTACRCPACAPAAARRPARPRPPRATTTASSGGATDGADAPASRRHAVERGGPSTHAARGTPPQEVPWREKPR